ncbi:MAG: Ig-like domain-containing protein, partial [Pseudomonadota bacterium]
MVPLFGAMYRVIAYVTLDGSSGDAGLYYADCQIELTVIGSVSATVVSPYEIAVQVSQGTNWTAFIEDTLAVTTFPNPLPSRVGNRLNSSGIAISGSNAELAGYILGDVVSVTANNTTFTGGLFAAGRNYIAGGSNTFNPLASQTGPQPPVANPDSASGNEDTQISIDVLANDDLNGSGADITDVSITTPPGSGTVVANVSANTLEYTPNADFNGTDSFQYEVGGSAPALVSITVAPVNDAPVASNLTASGTIGETIIIPIIASDPDGDPLTYEVIYEPPNSTITVSGDTLVVDTQVGVATPLWFTYFAFDGELMSSPEATVTIDPLDPPAPPTPPVANNDVASVDEDSSVVIDVLANDVPNGATLTIANVVVVMPPASGTVTPSPGGGDTLLYTPSADFNGNDSFVYRIDYEGVSSEPASVSIVVAPVNDPPVASDLTASGTAGDTITIPIIASDVDGDALTYSLLSQPAQGTASVVGETIVVQTVAGSAANLAFDYAANDGGLVLGIGTVTIGLSASPTPTPLPDDVIGDEDTLFVIDVLANDDLAGAPITIANVVVSAPPVNGTVVSNATTQTLDYTPALNFNGLDGFSYQIDYNGTLSDPVVVDVYIDPVNDVPVPSDLGGTGVAGDSISIPIIASDADGDTLTYVIATQPAQGSAAIVGDNIVVDTVAGSPSPLQFTYSATDGVSAPVVATVTVTLDAPNEAPTITSTPAYVVPEQQTYTYAVQATDPNNDALQYALGRAPAGAVIDDTTGVITWPAASADVNAVPDFNWLCREDDDLPLEDIVPQIKWEWLGSPAYPGVTSIKGPPVVGQLTDDNGDGLINEDDTPDLVFGANDRDAPSVGVMFALSGDTGAEIWAFDAISVAANGSLALGDIDGDGFVEIVAQDFARTQLFVLNHDGSLLWAVPTGPQHANQFGSKDGISLADLDGDGSPEIIHGRSVFNADGSLRWQGTGGHGGIIGYGAVSIVADVDLDGTPEVIAGNTIYDSVGNIKAQLPSGTDGFNAVGNFDADDEAEIVLVHSGLVALHNHDGSIIWNNRAIPGGGIGGPPTVADMDGDGEPEIGVAGRREYAVFETDGSLKWKFRVQDESSNRTGSSVFDFDNDGRAETLYIDEVDFFIFDSATGKLRYRDRNWSGTTLEYPSVVDVDGDGAADILVPSSQISPNSPGGGLRVLESALDPWPGTREIWNQHAYSIDNVNDDGTIPPSMAASWLSHNTFRLNTFIDDSPLDQADLIVSELRLDAATGDLIATVHNRGRRGSASTVTVGLFTAPNGGGTNLGYVDVGPLEAGLSASYSFSGINLASVGDTIYAVVDAASVQLECFEQNNQAQSAFFEVTVDDGNGATDTQQFSVYVTDVNAPPQIVSDPELSLEVGSPFADQVIAEDPDLGDAVAFSLTTFPNGLKINEKSGRITYDQFVLQAGLHPVTVLATDLRGLTATLSYDLNVTVNPDPNTDPEITSEPEALGEVGQDYIYTVIATDADFDTLDYTLRIAPPGMTINNITGIISWQPTSAGQFPVVVVVDDGFGGEASQSYAVRIEFGPANAAPVITSTPTSVVAFGANYQYSVIATDADGDPLTYSLDIAPTGMGIDASGNISWLADRTGTMPVAVTVGDGVNEAVQNWLLTVPVAAGDLSAALTATPTVIELGQSVAFTAIANNASGTSTLALDVDGNAVSLDAGGNGSFTPIDTGAFTAVLTVTDGADTTSAVAVFQVIAEQQPNQPPVITSAPPQSVNNTTAYSYTVTATDPEGDALSFSLPDAPTGMSIDSQTGLVSWLPDTEGNYPVAVRATDTSGNSATQSYTLSVVALGRTNVPPAFVSTPQLVTNLGQSYAYTAVATDADGDAVAYGLSVNPPGMSIDPLTGVVSWTPSQAEQVAVIIEAYDGLGGVATQAFSINVVAPANEAPAFTTVAPTSAVTGSTYLYGAAAADPDGDTINYSLLDAPVGMTVAADGTVVWMPVTSGNYDVTIQASDGIAA